MSAGNALPAGAPPECRPVASPEPGRPGSCPRSSAHVMATWWSPFVDVPTGRLMAAGSKGYTCPPATPIPRSDTTRRSRSVQRFQVERQRPDPPTGAPVCHGAHFGEGPVLAILAMLARKGALRVAPGGSGWLRSSQSPPLRAAAPAAPGRDGKAGLPIEQESGFCAPAEIDKLIRPREHFR